MRSVLWVWDNNVMHLQCSDGSLHPLWCSQSIRGNIFNNSSKQDNEKAHLFVKLRQGSGKDRQGMARDGPKEKGLKA